MLKDIRDNDAIKYITEQLKDNYSVKMKHGDDNVVIHQVQSFWNTDCTHCFFYGGRMLSIEYKDVVFIITANGDVRTEITDKDGNYLDYVKDKSENGILGEKLIEYGIDSDIKLNEVLHGNGPIKLDFESLNSNNNWWECYIVKGDEFIDLSWNLEEDTLFDALGDVLDNMEETYKENCINKDMPSIEEVTGTTAGETLEKDRMLSIAENDKGK